MDKISKLLKKLSAKDRERLEEALVSLLSGKLENLDIKKLRGVDEIYRVRVGTLRVIFQRRDKDIRILEMSRRDENTYEKY